MDVIDTTEEVASTEKTFYFCSKEFEILALCITDLHGWLYPTSVNNAKELYRVLWNILFKYDYAHLLTNCWFCC